ncbi:hypothetical protein BDV93DRAFT_528471 [Ceratobasidium sp. AG-I]|nr:hypothetical protein BDV93DRAFT_529127 [Ceratobasidium sp. AG-I]KAF8595759.1 hypothetical protein BDV93DRAFT_528471 [Ceratobasidium sp. AG-I]
MFRQQLRQYSGLGLRRRLMQGVPSSLPYSNAIHRSIDSLHCYRQQRRSISALQSLNNLLPGRADKPSEMPDPSEDDIQYLESAINQGDRLAGSDVGVQKSAKRRALIVAPRYADHDYANTPGIKYMPTTVRDARLIHDALGKRGYGLGNIRILADGFRTPGSAPTRQNILDSLQWLVAGTGQGDYRFFYFTGHGVRLPSEEGKGKKARKVNEGGKSGSDDYERDINIDPSKRLASQTVLARELTYYIQAIVTQISVSLHQAGVSYYIEDHEMNKIFSQLPVDSNITCVMDCCASGRMINNSVKVMGSGFRGVEPQSMGDKIRTLPSTLKRLNPFRTETMQEEFPLEDINMDEIKANILTWASCHQRQDSVSYPDSTDSGVILNSGLFTRLFVDALNNSISEPLLVEDMFRLLDTAAIPLGRKSNVWQYTQLWTSKKDKDEVAKLLKEYVKI